MGAINHILYQIKLLHFRRKWKRNHPESFVIPNNIFDPNLVSVGKCSYGKIQVDSYGRHDIKLKIGNFVSIAENNHFVLSGGHYLNTLSTYPFKSMILGEKESESLSKGNIVIDDDVWIGINVTILSGVHIGQGAVVGANSLITKDIPPYAIVGGVPGKIIKFRFNSETVDQLLKIDFSKLTNELIENHLEDLYFPLLNINQISWMPKKK